MTRRQTLIARSIVHCILTTTPIGEPAHHPSFLSRVLRLFRLYWLTFALVQPDLFKALRGVWQIKEEDYKASFGAESVGDHSSRNAKKKIKKKDVLHSMGDMGYSGSTFFKTSDHAYLVKSIPRHFEHDFFKNELLMPYAEHMQKYPASLLVRITNLLVRTHKSLGEALGLAPSHHIVMENILYGQNHNAEDEDQPEWESWDLKPTSYFFPERDIAGGVLASEATKSKLADKFEGKIKLTKADAVQFQELLEQDTQLLFDNNAVDYSLFLVRISAADAHDPESQRPLAAGQEGNEPVPPAQPPFSPPNPPSWRTGVLSSDGKEIYRASILDFFWAKHTFRAKAMTGLVEGYNLIDDQGPMSITAESDDYRSRFLQMCEEIVEVEE
ncbi:SAICAR synthase-like protein [Xylaria venustula]|nr:SAICAR synthase-like protein [Xylaria venustula]